MIDFVSQKMQQRKKSFSNFSPDPIHDSKIINGRFWETIMQNVAYFGV